MAHYLDLPNGVSLQVIYTDSKTILLYERLSHVREDLQKLDECENVCLDGQIMPLRTAYNRIGRDYLVKQGIRSVDSSKETLSMLVNGEKILLS